MGLDMYAFATAFKPESQVDFVVPEDAEKAEIQYWRKHPNLHGWMEELYTQKGGKEEFNCVNVQLIEEDLYDLKRAIQGANLPSTSGFFFGQSQQDEEETKEDLAFVEMAEKALKDGLTVYYSSWW